MKKSVLRVFRVMVVIMVFFVMPYTHQSKADISQNNTLIEAARDGDTERVKLLIDAGAEVNAQDEDGATALILAAFNGHTETVKALIDADADVNAQSKVGTTALIYAINGGYTNSHKRVAKAHRQMG